MNNMQKSFKAKGLRAGGRYAEGFVPPVYNTIRNRGQQIDDAVNGVGGIQRASAPAPVQQAPSKSYEQIDADIAAARAKMNKPKNFLGFRDGKVPNLSGIGAVIPGVDPQQKDNVDVKVSSEEAILPRKSTHALSSMLQQTTGETVPEFIERTNGKKPAGLGISGKYRAGMVDENGNPYDSLKPAREFIGKAKTFISDPTNYSPAAALIAGAPAAVDRFNANTEAYGNSMSATSQLRETQKHQNPLVSAYRPEGGGMMRNDGKPAAFSPTSYTAPINTMFDGASIPTKTAAQDQTNIKTAIQTPTAQPTATPDAPAQPQGGNVLPDGSPAPTNDAWNAMVDRSIGIGAATGGGVNTTQDGTSRLPTGVTKTVEGGKVSYSNEPDKTRMMLVDQLQSLRGKAGSQQERDAVLARLNEYSDKQMANAEVIRQRDDKRAATLAAESAYAKREDEVKRYAELNSQTGGAYKNEYAAALNNMNTFNTNSQLGINRMTADNQRLQQEGTNKMNDAHIGLYGAQTDAAKFGNEQAKELQKWNASMLDSISKESDPVKKHELVLQYGIRNNSKPDDSSKDYIHVSGGVDPTTQAKLPDRIFNTRTRKYEGGDGIAPPPTPVGTVSTVNGKSAKWDGKQWNPL